MTRASRSGDTVGDAQVQARPRVSVVIPVHNGARFLGETLDSLYAQTLDDFEIVLVDDASTDDLASVLARHADPRLHCVRMPSNVGVSAARNAGIERAQGEFIAFCDADDVCHPDRLERQLALFDAHASLGLCGTAFTCFDVQEREMVRHPVHHEEIAKALMAGNCFGLSTVMVRAQSLGSDRFDPGLGVAEDYDLWTRLVSRGVVAANLSDSLLRYRLHEHQASRTQGDRLDLVSRRVRAFYCARVLGCADALVRSRSKGSAGRILDDAAAVVQAWVRAHHGYHASDFRFFLAWIYQESDRHSVAAWWRWRNIQRDLGLDLDSTYRLNIALLALLPCPLDRRYHLHLAKLKR